jgi:hypothetical protein
VSGYTPVFRSIFQGTLCGKYPDLPVWLVLLALADRHGEIDAHPSYIATVSGLPQADVEAAIHKFCQPDDASRTADEDGRRLVPIPGRGFGWTIVNHGKYREKARLAARSEREVETGINAARMRQRREAEKTAGDRRRPPETAPDHPSDSDADSDSDKKKKLRPPPAANTQALARVREIFPKRAGGNPWGKAAKAINARIAEGATWEQLIAGTERYAAFCAATDKVGTEYVKQAATFFGPDRHYLEPWNPPATKSQAKQDANLAASLQWLGGTSQ